MHIAKNIILISLLPLAILLAGAFLAYILLDTNSKDHWQYADEISKKGIIVSDLLKNIGYGHSIHSFKNYILRGEPKYLVEAKVSIDRTFSLVNHYYKFAPLTDLEVQTMKLIKSTFQTYKSKLPLIEEGIANNWNARRIDNLVKVDDGPLMNHLEMLTTTLVTEQRAALRDYQDKNDRIFQWSALLIALITVISWYISHKFSKKIIGDFKRLNDLTHSIARDEMSKPIEFSYSHMNFEIATLAKQILAMKVNLEKAFDDLKRSNQELEMFTFAASHDLKSPLKKISIFSKLCLAALPASGSDDLREYINKINHSVSYLRKIIEGILGFALIQKQELKGVDLVAVINDIKDALSAEIDESRAVIKVESLPQVLGSKNQMIILFQNLIQNAIKFRSQVELPVVRIYALDRSEQTVTIAVEDNGIGLEPSELARVVRLFDRGESSENRPGLGIGLTTCAKILTLHDSHLQVRGARGVGTTFFFALKVVNGSSPS